MRLATYAIIVALRPHGEHDAIVRVLTADAGLQAGYARGGRSRRQRPVLMPGNAVTAELRARTEDQLPHLTAELAHSRAHLLTEPLAAAGIEWATTLTAVGLPEGQPYPALHSALDAVLTAIEAAPSARGWAAALARYELLLLSELGFGLDLTECALTGTTDDLAFVSPKSGRAVSAGAAGDYRDRLLPLPRFLVAGGAPDGWDDILAGYRLTGHFLTRDLPVPRHMDIFAARERLIERLRRIAG